LPLEGEVDDMFMLPAAQLRKQAITTPCIPTTTGLLVRPNQAHVCMDASITTILADARAQKLLVRSL